ncbi:non-specific lipid-transfer protein [Striga asiatica]|uniref:Non-specific lipid-transfer protein n=1 Tax=Striga asiatica TaxID=4170 RepID=A0A5A7RF21_STRAF|nr:non-specific lipid-transfer protein [Striga asiatica]
MAGQVKSLYAALIAAVLLAAVMPPPAAALGCGTVISYLSPCLPYVTGRGPIGKCCNGVKGLYAAAKTTTDRQTVCTCLKNIGSSTGGVNYNKAAGLPIRCGVNLPYKISPSTNCKSSFIEIDWFGDSVNGAGLTEFARRKRAADTEVGFVCRSSEP